MAVELSRAEIETSLSQRSFASLRAAFAEKEPADVAEAIEELDPEDQAIVFRLLQRELAADTFGYLEPESQEGLIKALAREHVATILNDMSPDDRTQLLEELPAAATKQVLTLLSPDERAIARQLLGYPEDSVGRLMTPDFISAHGNWTVQQTLDHVRRHGTDVETLNVLYVVDDSGHLVDDLRMRQLILADPAARISEICDGTFIALKATADQESAVQVFKEYDRVAFPVTDTKGVLLGIVTVDDVLDVAEEEATEDIQKIGGTEALEHPYMQVHFLTLVRKRAGWLVVLFLGQLLTLNAMGFFRDQLERLVVLILFVPLIISSGGNSGSQAATLVVRAMALGEVRLQDWWRVMKREVAFGLTLGLIIAGIGFLRIALNPTLIGDSWGPMGLVVGLSLLGVVLWGVIVGSMLPFVLRWLGADPAASSTPFVATIVDVTGLIMYLSIATKVMG